MEILVKTTQFLLSLSILIILHEMGHFLFARLFNTRVEKFYLFFNPWFSIFKKKIGETEYGLGWLPLGGYVKISGMIDESMDKDQLKNPPQSYEFRSKPSWQRLLIMLGGVLVNFIFALVIYVFVLYTWGEKYLPTENMTYGIMVDSTAMNMGFRNGDKILSLDGSRIENFQSIVHDIVVNDIRNVQVNRDGQSVNIEITPDAIAPLLKTTFPILPRMPFYISAFQEDSPAKQAGFIKGDRIIAIEHHKTDFFDEFKDIIPEYTDQDITITAVRNDSDTIRNMLTVPPSGLIGVAPDFSFDRYFQLREVQYSFIASIPAGVQKGFRTMDSYLKQLRLLFRPETKAYESIGGFIRIGSIFPGQWDWQAFWNMTAFLSIILAIMNMLPIPALDGGHVMFLMYEIITGRKPGDKFLEYAQIAGMILLFSLLFYANGNDIVQLFKK